MNILFVNYGDFTSNSLNHIGGFANALCASGHACIVAVPKGKDTVGVLSGPLFIPALFDEVLAKPNLFPDGRTADLIHAWTPREIVRKFVLAYVRQARARVIVHLEDNEEFLLSAWFGKPVSEVGEISETDLAVQAPIALPHPRRYRQFLRAADGVTVIVDSLRKFVPEGVPIHVLPPGIDPSLYYPRVPNATLRSELGIRDEEKVIVFTGSNTFANEPEMRDLYVAVALLNGRGVATRLIRAGWNSPSFEAGLPETLTAHVLDLGFLEKARLPALVSIADVLVQPGRPGPFNDFRLPSKLPEFFASGKPVILPASNLGTEVRDGVDALVLKTGSPEEIADLCERVFKDRGLAETLSRYAAAFAKKRFNLQAITRDLERFYREVAAGESRPGSLSTLTGEQGELSLALRGMAARTSDPAAAAIASDLVPLVADLEGGSGSLAEKARAQQSVAEAERALGLTRQHAVNLEAQLAEVRNLEEQVRLSKQHAANLDQQLRLAREHSDNIEQLRSLESKQKARAEEALGMTQQHLANLETKAALTEQHLASVVTKAALTEQHALNLEERLKATDAHTANLTKELADARGRLQRLEGKYAISEKLLASTRKQLDALDAEYESEITGARARIATVEELHRLAEQHAANHAERYEASAKHAAALERRLKLTREHGANLENLRATMQKRIAELDQQCAHLGRAIDERDARIAHLASVESKVRLMQASASWKLTSPLRSLRRALIDPWRKGPKFVAALQEAPVATIPLEPPPIPVPSEPPARASEPEPEFPQDLEAGPEPAPAAGTPAAPAEAAPPEPPGPPPVSFVRSVDNPQSWSLPPRKTLLRGWCFAEDGRPLTGVRAAFADRFVEGAYGFKRLDVFAAVRGKPQSEYCGWQMEVQLAAEDTLLDLEVRDGEGTWHPFFHTALRVGEGLGPMDLTKYEKWIEVYDHRGAAALDAQAADAGALDRKPLISVVMPVYNTPERWLGRAIASVRAQTYPHWELCIADDASPDARVRPILEQAMAEEPRIKVVFRQQNGHISEASNSALELASGDYVALLDHDDELAPHALFEVAAAANAHPEADLFYSDEDKIDEEGRRHEPYFKPDWQPDLFLGQNYTCHLSVYRASLVRSVGGFRKGYEGSQDWDLGLRVIDRSSAERIIHIPKVLYHWRAIPGSTALQLSEKNYPLEAARRALADHFSRKGEAVELVPVPGDHWRVKRALPTPAPLVSLVIPTRNRLELLRLCVESIRSRTVYPNYEVVIVDNHSDDPATLAWLSEIAVDRSGPPVRVIRHEGAFNFSAICNFGVSHARGEIVGLLNNDLETIHGDWLEEMVSHACRPEIGCVGAMLYYPNDTIQHAGVILGVGGVAGHAFRDFPRGTEGRFNRARLVQNYSAVTAACLLIRKRVYEEVGGLDCESLTVAFNDVDFCLKVQAAGYRNLWTPFAELYHHESASRGVDDTPEKAERFQKEVETMLRRWGPVLQHDPAYNPNLTLELNDFTLASPPRPGGVLSADPPPAPPDPLLAPEPAADGSAPGSDLALAPEALA